MAITFNYDEDGINETLCYDGERTLLDFEVEEVMGELEGRSDIQEALDHLSDVIRVAMYEVIDDLRIAQAVPRDEWPKDAFEYMGRHFAPAGNVDACIDAAMLISREGITLTRDAGYTHTDFYNAATREVDLFLCMEDGRTYIPGDECLFLWLGRGGTR